VIQGEKIDTRKYKVWKRFWINWCNQRDETQIEIRGQIFCFRQPTLFPFKSKLNGTRTMSLSLWFPGEKIMNVNINSVFSSVINGAGVRNLAQCIIIRNYVAQ
jgi:hypothetical protein